MHDHETWQHLPPAIKGSGLPLPAWAHVIARHLPRTAAAMLMLDYAQRTLSPLRPVLRAKMRLVVAMANRCDYSTNAAIADMKRAGESEQSVEQVLGGPELWPQQDQLALQFAHEHSINAPQIDDQLFEQLRIQYGERQVAAMVLLGAYGNFQDRLLLGLGIQQEQNKPLPPLDIEFAPDAFQTAPILPPNQPTSELPAPGDRAASDDDEWSTISYDELQARMQRQRQRRQRLPTPTWEEIVNRLPPGFNSRPTRIVWNLVCLGYVPELAVPWSRTTRTMWAEAQQDRVLEESLFWVQTRAVQCNYCMGHCEMLLEVAGLNTHQIETRLRHLAKGDWSAFPPHEQRAYAYASKLTKTPWLLTAADYAQLECDFGAKAAMAIFFWLCRGLYMTRVSDGFQLQLESDNVFTEFAQPSVRQSSQ
ncbi:MAG: hypothetical protein U1A77_10495 [Pirellulales bacterium]